ncbi:MAG TPA: DUF2182 domain-containing protein [Longimicrobiales bacterium]|nr:DUF2182 domain-containing protein [Longimicrobiales bacterium]
MWSVMMAAMMLPSATPTVLLLDRVMRQRAGRGGAGGAEAASAAARIPLGTAAFVAGYLLVWALYSLAAATAQWLLHRALLVSPAMVSASPWLSGGLLIVAGAYQWTPFKDACLAHCRSPIGFLSRHWREGRAGPFVMGLVHGSYCVGCCWALMALLFVLGVMNVLWVLALAILVLLEKTLPGGTRLTRVAGIAFAAWGVWVLIRGA